MTYGEQLDQAAAALAAARAALRQPNLGAITDHEAAAIARTQIYRALEQQVATIAGGGGGNLARELQRATRNTPPSLPLPPPPRDPVAVALHEAAEAIRTGGDLLAAHFAPGGRPLTSDALAITAGVDRQQNLARLAQLARATNTIDRQLAAWLRSGQQAGSRQPVVQAAAADAHHTANTPQPHTRRVAAEAAAEAAGEGRLRGLEVPVHPEPGEPWPAITSPQQFIRAVDAARGWLVRHRNELTAADLRLLTRTGLALSFEATHLVRATIGQEGTTEAITALAARWRRASAAAEALQSLARPLPGAGPAALAAAEAWLREQLRPAGRWLDPSRTSFDDATWRATAHDLAARLPDIATLVHRGAEAAVHRGELLDAHGLQRPAGQLVAVPRWTRADPTAGNAAELLNAARQLRRPATALAAAAGTTPLPGLHEADTRYRFSRTELQNELRRIAATEPISGAARPQAAEPEHRRERQAEPAGQEQQRAEQQRLDEQRRLDEQHRTTQQQDRRGPHRGL